MKELGKTKCKYLVDFFKEKILDGDILKGDKMPSEYEIVKKYKMSRHTVRRAFLILKQEGYVIAKQGSGYFCSYDVMIKNDKKQIWILFTEKNRIYDKILLGIQNTMKDSQYTFTVRYTNNDSKKEEQLLKEALFYPVAGLIIEPIRCQIICPHMKSYVRLQNHKIPFVMIQGLYPQMEEKDCIVKNDMKGSYLSTRYFIRRGYRNMIGIFCSDTYSGIEQHRGYVKALQEYGIFYDPQRIIWFHEEDQGEKPSIGLKLLIKQGIKIEGILCQTDKLALEVKKVLKEYGKQIENKIEVIGNIGLEEEMSGRTGVVYCFEKMGEYAMIQLKNYIENRRVEEIATKLEPRFLIGSR